MWVLFVSLVTRTEFSDSESNSLCLAFNRSKDCYFTCKCKPEVQQSISKMIEKDYQNILNT